MAAPTPVSPVADSCSVIHNETLFVYSRDSFQSIRLAEGEQWSQLPSGVPASGARCAYAVPHGNQSEAALYVVGGITNMTSDKYSGLQKYSFQDRSWKNITMANPVAAERTNHDAIFLDQNATMLIFSGSQDSANKNVPSMQTFCIHTDDNYRSIAYSADKAPAPRVAPQLLQWNQSHAAMIGGGTLQDIYLFSPQYRQADSPWTKLGFSLPRAIPDRTKIQAVIVQGSDGTKVLETFDMGATPNTVQRVVLENAAGKGPSPGQTIGDPPSKKRRRSSHSLHTRHIKRDLTASAWPTYNDSLAPSTARQGYSIAQDPQGLVAVVGGDDQAPLILFNSTRNSWLNATEFLTGKATAQSISTTSSTTSFASTPTSTASSSPSSTTAGNSPSSIKPKSLKILGASLGAIFGVAVLLVIALLVLRWLRKRRQFNEAGHQRRASGLPENDGLSFVDRGVSFGSDTGFIPREYASKEGAHAHSAIAIVGGRAEHQPQKRGLFSKGRTSSGTSSIFNRVRGKPALGSEMQMEEKPGVSFAPSPVLDDSASKGAVDGAGKQRSSGWSRYFSGASATNLATTPGRNTSYTDKTHSSHGSQSGLTGSRASAGLAAFNLSRSNSGQLLQSKELAEDADHMAHGSSAAPMARQSSTSTVSSISRHDAFSSGIPASIHDDNIWTPMGHNDWNGRAASSIYTDSNRGSAVPRDDTSIYPRDSAASRWNRVSNTQTSALPRRDPGITITNASQNQDFGATAHSDMSWLNLGNAR